ncbi:MAG: DUF6868 family protein [Boseongicola sp.]
MTVEVLTQFFAWMTVINLALFLISVVFSMLFRDFGTAMHARMFGMDPNRVAEIWYFYLGAFKIAIIVLNLTPYLALRFFM